MRPGKAEIRPSASDRETKHTDSGANSCLMGGHGRSLTLAYGVRDELTVSGTVVLDPDRHGFNLQCC